MAEAGRYFVGIEVPVEVCGTALTAVQERLEPHLQVKKWYRPEQLHITSTFLGELTGEQVELVVELLEKRVREHRAFSLQLGKVGWFPRAKVVWCGVEAGMDAAEETRSSLQPLYDLQAMTAQDLSVLGTERYAHDTYRPHITLGRLHTADPAFRPELVEVADLLQGKSWIVEALHLYESVSNGAQGPSYPKRYSFPLSHS
ncbi:MAG TPA: RNA 2',3'-cyclic phosphodiesterase [Bacilli bacterium]|nr:RNA 2',3'-cyclic phosphodiesterase [Bacilli bacterium]